jgi:hypothetical protein
LRPYSLKPVFPYSSPKPPTEETMAKGQMRSNKEKRKPKKDKDEKKGAKK